MLRSRLHDDEDENQGAVQVQVPLVLLRGVRGVREGRPDLNLQLSPRRPPVVCHPKVDDDDDDHDNDDDPRDTTAILL